MRLFLVALAFSLALLTGCASTPHAPGSYVASLDGKAVHYDDYASGKAGIPIVLVHGWASDNRVWKHNIPGLSEHRRVLAVELPGHGRSEIPSEYTMDVFAAGIAAAMDDAGIAQAVLVGHSNGVPTVRQFYRNYPQRTVGLVCVDGALRRMFPKEMVEQFTDSMRGEDYRGFVESQTSMMLGVSKLLSEEDRHDLRDMILGTAQPTLVGGMAASAADAIWATDDPIAVPVLVVNAQSPFWTDDYRAYVDGLVTGRPYAYHEWVGVSHMLMMEKAEEFNGLVEGFVGEIEK